VGVVDYVNVSYRTLRVEFDEAYLGYDLEGFRIVCSQKENRKLFWDEIKFEIPPQSPRMKLIHGVEVPDIVFKPGLGEDYYAVDFTDKGFYVEYDWGGDELDYTLYERGLCYPFTEEGKKAAILHAKAMLGIKE